jgi:hypothetical protein
MEYLGLAVHAYRSVGNPVDRGTSESVLGSYVWQIATPQQLPRYATFLLARAELVTGLHRGATNT